MQWSDDFYAQLRGAGCAFCEDGRPEASAHAVRFFAGEAADAYLVRADVQRGLSVVIFRGRHVVEPTDLTDSEAAAYGREVMRVARAIQTVMQPVKLNYDVLGNSIPHLHTHLVPRYADDPRPGWPFPFPDPMPPPMPEERLMRDVEALRRAL
jgi:diadenosine tetraphosphate (Ap4A) HIT family hydrolase